ncbi:MAG: hypothetical protein WD737_00385 [Gemmatimonadota bacterium]
MTRELDTESTVLLRTLLGETSPLLPFAEAVVLHLCMPPARIGAPADVIAVVAEMLNEEALAGSDAEVRRRIRAHPQVLASFFQNADLLEHHTAEAALVGRMVMAALEDPRPSESH